MKHRLLPALAVLFLCTWAASAFACEHEQKTASAARTAIATQSAVAAHGAGCCATSKTTAVTADYKAGSAACAHGASAAKSASACAGKDAAAAHSSACKAYGVGLVTASDEGCAYKGAMGASGVDAVMTGGSACRTGQAMAHGIHDCDACAELAICDDELRKIGLETQVVPLKNGVMIVYTATTQGRAQAIQNAMARRNDRLNAVTASRDRAKLCTECKAMRGAMASGKLTRETVNIGGGVLTVMTSNDPKIVARLQGLAVASKT